MPPIARAVVLILIGTVSAAAADGPGWSSTSANRPFDASGGFLSGAERISPTPSVVPAASGEAAVPLSPPHRGQGLALPARNEKSPAGASVRGLDMLLTTGGALALVIGLILVLAWTLRRARPQGSLLLPGDVVELLGRAPLASRQQVHLLRCGNKLLLVSVTPTGAETLTEITDPMEVDRLAGLCRQAQPGSSTAAFRQMLDRFSHDSGDSDSAQEHSGMLDARAGRRRRSWEEANG